MLYDVVNFCVQIDGRPWLQRSDEDVSLISSRELCVVDDALRCVYPIISTVSCSYFFETG